MADRNRICTRIRRVHTSDHTARRKVGAASLSEHNTNGESKMEPLAEIVSCLRR
jgi:hypothetical protein